MRFRSATKQFASSLLLLVCSLFFLFALLHTSRATCCEDQQASILSRCYRHQKTTPCSRGLRQRFRLHRGAEAQTMAAVGAVAHEARLEAKNAMEIELAAQVKLHAALSRQNGRHDLFLKQLKAEGWNLNSGDGHPRKSIIEGRAELQKYLQSKDYQDYSLTDIEHTAFGENNGTLKYNPRLCNPKFKQKRRRGMSGKGILIAAGGPVPLANAYVALHMLRQVHKCMLPVEIYYNGPHEIDPTTKGVFEREFLDTRCINIASQGLPFHQLSASHGHVLSRQQSGWVLKAHMLAVTSLQEVLVLDADNVPLADPSYLFQIPEYKTAGNLFWPDFWSRNWHNPAPIYNLLNLSEPWETQPDLLTTESGQLLLNREKFEEVLEWILFLNLQADTIYSIIWGDKDTYRLAFALAGQAQYFQQVKQHPANALRIPWQAGMMKQDTNEALNIAASQESIKAYSHAGMVQLDPSGKMLFLHRTADSKLDPRQNYPLAFSPVEFLTPPLTPRQAAQVHISGPMDVSKFQIASHGCSNSHSLDLLQVAIDCSMLGSKNEAAEWTGSFPVPLFDISTFPGLHQLLNESMQAFVSIQQRFRLRLVPLGAPM